VAANGARGRLHELSKSACDPLYTADTKKGMDCGRGGPGGRGRGRWLGKANAPAKPDAVWTWPSYLAGLFTQIACNLEYPERSTIYLTICDLIDEVARRDLGQLFWITSLPQNRFRPGIQSSNGGKMLLPSRNTTLMDRRLGVGGGGGGEERLDARRAQVT
jgi:hypothetical protein